MRICTVPPAATTDHPEPTLSIYGNLATFVVAFHFAFLLFVMFGGLLVLRWPRAVWLHIPCLLWGSWIEVSGGVCPLTPLENSLRRAAGESAYAGSFIEHYIMAVMYPSGLTRSIQLALAVGLVLLNLVIYGLVVRQRRRRRAKAAAVEVTE